MKTEKPNLTVVSAKELSYRMGIHHNTACHYINDIKEQFQISIVLEHHINLYFKV